MAPVGIAAKFVWHEVDNLSGEYFVCEHETRHEKWLTRQASDPVVRLRSRCTW